MTRQKKLRNSILNGLITGTLLAATTRLWLQTVASDLLPLLVTTWWLIIFGSSLIHAYQLLLSRAKPIFNVSMQVIHAALSALVYFSTDFILSIDEKSDYAVKEWPPVILGGVKSQSYLPIQEEIIAPILFLLMLLTSGLLYSILSKPSAR